MDYADNTWTNKHNEVICPWCFSKQYKDSEQLVYTEGKESELACEDCEKEFINGCTFVSFSRESRKKF